jgi:hypothetical protein
MKLFVSIVWIFVSFLGVFVGSLLYVQAITGSGKNKLEAFWYSAAWAAVITACLGLACIADTLIAILHSLQDQKPEA